MSSNSIQKLKEDYSKQRRRQELHKKFAQKRKQLSIQLIQREKQTFESLIPVINYQNYEENRLLLNDFARSLTYSYQMLPIAFISYEYLLENHFDILSWEILTNLSYYEDFQIPQTFQFAKIFMQLLNTEQQLASQFLLNISNLPKCSLLCCRLIDEGIIQSIGQIINKTTKTYWINSLENVSPIIQEKLQILIFNLLIVLGNIFTLKPIIQINQMERICEILIFQTKSNKFLKQVHDQAIFRLIQNVVSEFSSQKNVISLIIYHFSQTMCNSFFTYEGQSLFFMRVCIKNKIKLNEKLIQNLFISIRSKNNKNKVLALNLLQKILIPSQKKQKMQIQGPKINYFGSNFLAKNTLPSLEEFASFFSVNNEVIETQQNSNQQRSNTLMAYKVLFNSNYENNFKTLLEIYENSGQKIQEEIVGLIKAIVKCVIRQIHNYEPKNLIYGEQDFQGSEMEGYLFLTVEMQEIYVFLSQCLKSSKKEIILNSLQILRYLLMEFKQQRNQEEQMNNEIGYEYLLNQIQKFSFHSSLNSLMDQQNSEITQLSQIILNLIQEDS